MGATQKKTIRVIERDGNICHYCKREFDDGFFSRTLDHIIPKSKGGTDVLENLVLSCKRCNVWKGGKDYQIFIEVFLPRYLSFEKLYPDKVSYRNGRPIVPPEFYPLISKYK